MHSGARKRLACRGLQGCRVVQVGVALVLICLCAAAGEVRVPGDFDTLEAALGAVADGDTIALGEGTFKGNFKIDKKLALVGAKRRSVVEADKGVVLTVSGEVTLASLTIRGGETGVQVKKAALLRMRDCRVEDCRRDGVGFENSFNTRVVVSKCEFTRCGDAVDLESAQAIIHDCDFTRNKDDGVDFDGDCAALVFGCNFLSNGDDGIEIRLKRVTHALIVRNRFEANGEDGVEFIQSPVPEEKLANLALMSGNTFSANGRYGVGAVDNDTEKSTDFTPRLGVFGNGNSFDASKAGDLSPNLSAFGLAKDRTAHKATVSRTGPDGEKKTDVAVKAPIPLAIYDLAPSPDGQRVLDAEGVEVSPDGKKMYLADDNARSIWVIDTLTARFLQRIPVAPLPGTLTVVKGAEGFAFEPKDDSVVWLTDDEGKAVHQLSLTDDGMRLRKTYNVRKCHGMPEGLARSNDVLFVIGSNTLTGVSLSDWSVLKGFPVKYSMKPRGSHVAGVCRAGEKLLITATAYGKGREINHGGLLLEADPADGAVSRAWSLADYCNDPRGVSFRNGLVYVCDGLHISKLPDGQPNRVGMKVLVFAIDEIDSLDRFVEHLPLRQRKKP